MCEARAEGFGNILSDSNSNFKVPFGFAYILFMKCLYSNKASVVSHFIFRSEVSIEQCKKLLKMPIGKTIQNEILRAIKVKEKKKI